MTLPTETLRGIIPPLITPLADAETIDSAGLERLVAHVLEGGVAGLFLLGTTGEGPSLAMRLRQQLIDEVAEHVAGRVPLLVAITDTSLVESIDLAEYAADAQAAAVVVAPPPYYPIEQRDLLDYLTRLAGQSPLPVYLYNMPSHCKLTLDLEVVARASELPNVVGIKDSSGDMKYLHRLLALAAGREDFSVFIGPEELLAESVLLGAHGGVSGGANLHPRLYVALYEAAARGDLAEVRCLHAQVMALAAAVYSLEKGSPGVIKGLKVALQLAGICSAAAAPPLVAFGPVERETLRRRLATLELPVEVAQNPDAA